MLYTIASKLENSQIHSCRQNSQIWQDASGSFQNQDLTITNLITVIEREVLIKRTLGIVWQIDQSEGLENKWYHRFKERIKQIGTFSGRQKSGPFSDMIMARETRWDRITKRGESIIIWKLGSDLIKQKNMNLVDLENGEDLRRRGCQD